MTALEVVASGLLTTVQDLGRPGWAHLGVPRSGALDAPALELANALVGNPVGAAGLETTLTGCSVRTTEDVTVAVTGASAAVSVGGRPARSGAALAVARGEVVTVGPAERGARSYLAVSGGIAVEAVLGSRATDILSGLGPPPLTDGSVLPVGRPAQVTPTMRTDPRPLPDPTGITLRIHLGPREDRLTAGGRHALTASAWTVSSASNRVGVRLDGPALERSADAEIESEGMVLGAVQVPADGHPIVFLADHPTTGGYPVVAVVDPDDLAVLAQAAPGTPLRLMDLTGAE